MALPLNGFRNPGSHRHLKKHGSTIWKSDGVFRGKGKKRKSFPIKGKSIDKCVAVRSFERMSVPVVSRKGCRHEN